MGARAQGAAWLAHGDHEALLGVVALGGAVAADARFALKIRHIASAIKMTVVMDSMTRHVVGFSVPGHFVAVYERHGDRGPRERSGMRNRSDVGGPEGEIGGAGVALRVSAKSGSAVYSSWDMGRDR